MTNSPVPPHGPQHVLALAQLSNSVGDGAYYTTSALYFTQVIGLAPARVRFGLAAAGRGDAGGVVRDGAGGTRSREGAPARGRGAHGGLQG
jgi:hypothetical protein